MLLYHFIGGWALFSGMALCLSGACLKCVVVRPVWLALARIASLAGLVIVLLSAAPLSPVLYAVFFALLALIVLRPDSWWGLNKKLDQGLLLLVLGLGLYMVGIEARQFSAPRIDFKSGMTMYVIGDSLSMGADLPGKNWPDLLGDRLHLKVRNFSFGGARVGTSVDHALRVDREDALVVLEIGGNDLLGGTSIPQFRDDLDKMLSILCRGRRKVAMIELPLPPLYNRFGRVQRGLATSHGAVLIPKRYLARVICSPGATVDGLHLSNAGHQLLAEALCGLFVENQ
jgi:acyl-CoA thioesterase-1